MNERWGGTERERKRRGRAPHSRGPTQHSAAKVLQVRRQVGVARWKAAGLLSFSCPTWPARARFMGEWTESHVLAFVRAKTAMAPPFFHTNTPSFEDPRAPVRRSLTYRPRSKKMGPPFISTSNFLILPIGTFFHVNSFFERLELE